MKNTKPNQLETSHDTRYFTIKPADREELKRKTISNRKRIASRSLCIGAVLSILSALATFVLVPALMSQPCDSGTCMGHMAFIGIWYISVPLLAYSLSLLIAGTIYYANRKRIKKIHPYLLALIPTIPLCFLIVFLIKSLLKT